MKSFIKTAIITCMSVMAIAPTKVLADQFPIPLPKGQWQPFAKDGKGNITSFDQGSIFRQGDIAAFWMKVSSGSSNFVANEYYATNCPNRVMIPLWTVLADKQGHILRSVKPTNLPAIVVQPGLPGWQVLNVVCGTQDPAVQAQAAQAEIVIAQLEALTRNSASSAEAISNAMNAGASLFK